MRAIVVTMALRRVRLAVERRTIRQRRIAAVGACGAARLWRRAARALITAVSRARLCLRRLSLFGALDDGDADQNIVRTEARAGEAVGLGDDGEELPLRQRPRERLVAVLEREAANDERLLLRPHSRGGGHRLAAGVDERRTAASGPPSGAVSLPAKNAIGARVVVVRDVRGSVRGRSSVGLAHYAH